MKNFLDRLPGAAVCLGVACVAWLLGRQIPIVGGAVFAILLGMLAGLIRRSEIFDAGIRFTSKKVLQYSIILLGFEMNMHVILRVGTQSLFVMLFTLTASFVTAWIVSRILHIPGPIAILIGVGTSICGGSAIAATAPVIRAKDEEVAQAISVIFLFNIIAVFLFPALGHLMGLSDTGFGMWAGTAVNDTSSVVAAASSWSQRVGNNTALQFATVVKLTRTLMIVPITLVLAFYISRKEKRAAALRAADAKAVNQPTDIGTDPDVQTGDPKTPAPAYSFARIFPWFVLGFVAAALAYTFLPIPQAVSSFLVEAGKFLIIMAMAAIGLQTNMRKLLTQSGKPLFLGLCCWGAVACVSLLVQFLTNLR